MPGIRLDTLMYPKMVTASAMIETTVKTASLIRTRRSKCTLGPLVELVGERQRIALGVGAGLLADRAPPLHLQLGQLPLESGAGEKRGVKPAQRQIQDEGQIGEVTTEPIGDRLLVPRESRQKAQ